MNAKNHSTTINCPACYSSTRKRLPEEHDWDYECNACGCWYSALTLSDQRRIERAKAHQVRNVTKQSMIADNENERAKLQKDNESYYAGIMERAKASLSAKQLKALEEAENGDGNAYGVTKDPVKGAKKRAVQAHKRRGYHQGKRNK